MGKRRMSTVEEHPPDVTSSSKKKKKKRRLTDPDKTTSTGDVASPERTSSKGGSKLVLRCAPHDAVSPVLVSFSNLTMPSNPEELKFSVHGGTDPATENQRVVMAEGSRMDYWGTNFGAGAESNDLCRYLVGIEDSESGEITLYEAGHAFALRQNVTGRDDMVEDHANADAGWKESRDRLVDNFGSKKKKAAIRSRDANVIEADSVVGGGALSRVLSKTVMADKMGSGDTDGAAEAVEEARRRFLPPMRAESSVPEGVYNADDIARPDVLEFMAKQVEAKAEGLEGGLQEWLARFAEQPRERCPVFVSKRLQKLHDLSLDSQRVRMLQLLFLRHMCVFAHCGKQLKGTLMVLSNRIGIPTMATKHLLEKFMVCESKERGGVATYSRTKTLTSQLLVHALCLALLIDGCRLEFEDLAQDLKLSQAETRALVRELGCTASNATAQLKIPLAFPRSRKARA